jgi:hypothetical protein
MQHRTAGLDRRTASEDGNVGLCANVGQPLVEERPHGFPDTYIIYAIARTDLGTFCRDDRPAQRAALYSKPIVREPIASASSLPRANKGQLLCCCHALAEAALKEAARYPRALVAWGPTHWPTDRGHALWKRDYLRT